MLTKTEQGLLNALEAHADEHGIEIVTVEVTGARKSPTIRVYIDAPNGVNFDELTRSQKWINDLMDEIDPFPGAYVLEVSSPGIDRPLRTPEHFKRFVGSTVVVRASEAVNGRANWTATLTAADDAGITVCDDASNEATIPYEKIKRANVKGIIDFSR
ncbi:MAG: ribosome maturation factor RimP [Eggerthellaceae bacterium]|nr:ribosome maturation factor RimP [Eggerthellaceae bacterium]